MEALLAFLVFLLNLLLKGIVVGLLLKQLLATYTSIDFHVSDGVVLVLICNLLFSAGPIGMKDEGDEGKR